MIKDLIKEPEDFVVKEIIEKKFLSKFTHSFHTKKVDEKYSLYILKKRNMNTRTAIKEIAKRIGIKEDDIGYAGLKDKKAVTCQYITIPSGVEIKNIDNVELEFVKKTDKMINKGDLIGNEFVITLYEFNKNTLKKIVDLNHRKIKNFFGDQRFGKNMNNHEIGKLILLRKFKDALLLINNIYQSDYKNLKQIDMKEIKFFINAYQSFAFNKALKNTKSLSLSLPGFYFIDNETEMIMEKDGIKQKDFNLPELGMRCRGSKRECYFTTNINYEIRDKKLILSFFLPKGCYATTVLSELYGEK